MSAPVRRLPSLDGLRGIAAVVVVVHHCFLTDPRLYDAVIDHTMRFSPDAWLWWVTYTPVHLVWAGTEAVYVFFVLSGLVLTFAAQAAAFSWRSYYPQRLARLYLPVWASVALAALLLLLVPRPDAPLGAWIDERATHYGRHALLLDVTLLNGHSGIVSPLWSLRWEVWFSLLLPAYLVLRSLAARSAAGAYVCGVALLAVVGWGTAAGNDIATYMPMFGLGVLLAARWVHLAGACRAWSNRRWALLLAGGVLLLLARWLWPAENGRQPLQAGLACAGAVAIVLCFGLWDKAVRVGGSPWARWLGRISFSLYLVHDPIIVMMRSAAPTANPWLWVVPTFALAIVGGWGFYRLIERPLHLCARRVGQVFAAR